ncbi:hypothetical protein SCATT_p17120 (plasmid) [Streptantibioticus cattleyicolor NRRL 8057 = DSM 46488]|uniref:Uncharacterized protein n=1 Tax=Streptantibioticus cattleyicolor (strain ATCC 35852 / DSM 46488 / JCM 4925 / NBRC 14057 / NRRL 8057) TaxID=1003195 RepID=G8XHZ9_STREN|nr:hypothetical protein SCATT_p17120 [Streptantibioticus cattleyicolor NRRL 8057 = DSM 46488]
MMRPWFRRPGSGTTDAGPRGRGVERLHDSGVGGLGRGRRGGLRSESPMRVKPPGHGTPKADSPKLVSVYPLSYFTWTTEYAPFSRML